MDSSSVILGLRVVLSLACVLGLLWFAARKLSGTPGAKRHRAAALTVVSRQQLVGKAGVALVEVSGRRLLLGVSEHGVSLLTEIDVDPPAAEPVRTERVELDPALLGEALLDEALLDEALLDEALLDDVVVPSLVPTLEPLPSDARELAGFPSQRSASQLSATHPSSPAARMPAVPKQRNPLEGSILDASTWRQAVVAVQERTIRR